MTELSLAAQIRAVFLRRTPAYLPNPGDPATFPDRIIRLVHRTQPRSGQNRARKRRFLGGVEASGVGLAVAATCLAVSVFVAWAITSHFDHASLILWFAPILLVIAWTSHMLWSHGRQRATRVRVYTRGNTRARAHIRKGEPVRRSVKPGAALNAGIVQASSLEVVQGRSDADGPALAALTSLASTLQDLGSTLQDLGRNRAARTALTEAATIYRELAASEPRLYRPDLAATLTRLGSTLQDLGRNRAARAALTEAATIYRELLGLPDRHSRRGGSEEVERWLRQEVESGNTYAMAMLGDLLAERGEREEAERWFLLGADSGEISAMTNLAVLFAERGESEEADRWYRRAVEPGNTDTMTNLDAPHEGEEGRRKR